MDSCNIFGSRCGSFTGVEKLHQSLVKSSVPQHGRPFVFWMSGRWLLRSISFKGYSLARFVNVVLHTDREALIHAHGY